MVSKEKEPFSAIVILKYLLQQQGRGSSLDLWGIYYFFPDRAGLLRNILVIESYIKSAHTIPSIRAPDDGKQFY